jgi:hypothetical protein
VTFDMLSTANKGSRHVTLEERVSTAPSEHIIKNKLLGQNKEKSSILSKSCGHA